MLDLKVDNQMHSPIAIKVVVEMSAGGKAQCSFEIAEAGGHASVI